jgi:protocatechuate 3,4-dioxygenase beta subunit
MKPDALTRREMLQAGGAGFVAIVGLAPESAGAGVWLATTPACRDEEEATPPLLAGPYFKPDSPMRRNLREVGVTGVRLTLRGRVFDRRCGPVSKALLDFWQCDRYGNYDRRGFRLRGHQYADGRGGYVLGTIVPNHYQRRTPHIHVKVQPPRGPVLTTQLFFPPQLHAYGMDVGALNDRDQFIDERCLVRLGPLRSNQYSARFDFVVAR